MTSETPYKPVPKELPLLVHVTAPATLPAGYTFEAEINGDPSKLFTCEVPESGVQEGQLFLAPLPKNYAGTMIEAPTGRWKDGLMDCFTNGVCHPALWCAWCCHSIAIGQVMSRMQLTWLGQPGPITRTQQAFKVVVILTISYYVYSIALETAAFEYSIEAEPLLFSYLRVAGSLLFMLWSVYSLWRTRETVRARYQIKEQICNGCEDFCCSLWCSCCTVAQIMRHTGEYETYPGVCCSATGHPPGTPIVV